MIGRKYLLAIFTLPAFIFASFSAANTKEVYAGNECLAVLDLDKVLSKNQATVKNNSDACEHEVTLALYNSPQEPETTGWILTQTLIGSDTKVIKPGEEVNFFVEDTGKSCFRQSDLFEGAKVLEPPLYVNILATDVFTVPCVTPTIPLPTPTITPTLIPSPTPTAVPTVTPTPLPTNTPVPGPTSTTTPVPTATPTPVPTSSQSVLASTGNIAFMYAVIISGISLITGLILKRIGK